jgi:uncharacterized protein
MLLIRTYIAPSMIDGVGVFAAEFISAGRPIWSFDPRFDLVFTRDEIAQMPQPMRDYVRKYSFPHYAQANAMIMEGDNGRYMNHSETPNIDFTPYDSGVARTDILAGEELTANYREFDPSFTGRFAAGIRIRQMSSLNGTHAD